jgi:hypothetical protein
MNTDKLINYDGSETYKLIIKVDGLLDDEEVERSVGILGYALSPVRGEEVLLDSVTRKKTTTYIKVNWDSTKSRSDDLGDRIFEIRHNFSDYMKEGTPIRTTDRAGKGTRGTRLLSGIGFNADIMLEVSERRYRIQVIVDGVTVMDKEHMSLDTPDVSVKYLTDK